MLRPLAFLLVCALPSAALAHDPVDRDIAALTARLAAAPADVGLLLARADLYRRAGRSRAALDDLLMVEALEPGSVRMLVARARVHADLGHEDEAEASLDRALEAGLDREALGLRATLRERAGRLDGALEDHDAALSIGDSLESRLGRGRVLSRLGRTGEAIAHYRASLPAMGGAVLLRVALVEELARAARYDEALAEIDAAARGARMPARWLLRRGEVLDAAGRTGEARAAREDALAALEARLRRRSAPALELERARALLALGRRADAEAALVRLRHHAPSLGEAEVLLRELRGRR